MKIAKLILCLAWLAPGWLMAQEGPDDVHVVGRNASQTKPAKFVVFLVKEKGAPVLIPTN
jgi:hypothetical protein